MATPLETRIGYIFRNPKLLEQALLHPSFHKKARQFERLEFLGDRVLGLVIADWLFSEFPKESEGLLAQRLASLVCRDTCMHIATILDLENHVRFITQDPNDPKNKITILSDSIEALLGAIYLDNGLKPSRAFIQKFWADLFLQKITTHKDVKSRLQEWVQSLGKSLPVYKTVNVSGAAHTPIFTIQLTVEDFPPLLSEGSSKKDAERNAAIQFLDMHSKFS